MSILEIVFSAKWLSRNCISGRRPTPKILPALSKYSPANLKRPSSVVLFFPRGLRELSECSSSICFISKHFPRCIRLLLVKSWKFSRRASEFHRPVPQIFPHPPSFLRQVPCRPPDFLWEHSSAFYEHFPRFFLDYLPKKAPISRRWQFSAKLYRKVSRNLLSFSPVFSKNSSSFLEI